MPTLDDFDKENEDPGGIDDGLTPAQAASTGMGTATGAPKQAKASVGQQQQYTPWSSFVSANRDVSQREAGKLQSGVEGDISKAQSELGSAQQGFNQGIDSNYSKPPKSGGQDASQSATAAPVADLGASTSSAASPQNLQPSRALADFGQTLDPTGEGATASPTSNPWASFLPGKAPPTPTPPPEPPAPPPGPPPGSQPPGPPPAPPTGKGRRSLELSPQLMSGVEDTIRAEQLQEAAAGGNPLGAHDLEGAAGAEAWQQLLGDTVKATDEANALGSEGGVQALLQRDQTTPIGDSAFDAALLEGQGQRGFQDVARQYGGDKLKQDVVDAENASQQRWAQLQGDIARYQALHAPHDAEAQAGGDAAPADDTATTPEEYQGSINDVLFGDGATAFWSDLHKAGLTLSPADQGSIAAADALNQDLPMPTEAFVSAATGAIAKETSSSWPAAKVKMAYDRLASEYDPPALHALLGALKNNPAMLNQYLHMTNPGFMMHQMRQWLASAGFQKRAGGPHGNQHETRGTGATGETYTDAGGQQRTTTDEQETQRLQAYREGWGQDWDDQFNSGVDAPSRGGSTNTAPSWFHNDED